MVEFVNVRAGYGSTPVVSDITARFEDGSVTVLLGPNGSGKSTLLRSVVGLSELQAGSILLDGIDREALTLRQRAQSAAYLPQNRPVPSITARRLVLHGRFPYLGYPRHYTRQDHAIVAEAIRAVGAEEFADRPLPALSGGQSQRIYIAMALAQDTPTILLDEPTSFLDVHHQLELVKLARSLADRGRAVVMILHDLCLAMRCADRIAVLSGGRLTAFGTPEEIFASGVTDEVFGVHLCRVRTGNGWRYYYD